jgi:hypothetical protein
MLDFLENYFQDADLKNIVTDIIGTSDPKAVISFINEFAAPHCDSKIEKILFLEPSAGAVFGFLLASGKKVILKLFNKNISHDYLLQMNDIQKIFYEEKYPAPAVLSPIFQFNRGYAGFYEFIEGNKENAHKSEIRDELALHLAKFSDIIDKHRFLPMNTFMQESIKNKLWPTPHNVLFDLEKTTQGAEWIDSKAKVAKQILDEQKFQKKLAYTDWSVKNTIYKDRKLIGVFDWDALGCMSEPEMVGSAAAQFTADWESGNKVTPTPDEARSFVKSYEKYRGRVFTKDELKIASASSDYLIALISRFEHAGGDPHNHPYQDLLKKCCGKSFLFQSND